MSKSKISRLFFTGGTGFFGRSLLRHWVDNSDNSIEQPTVVALTRSPRAFLARFPEFQNYSWLRFHAGDILDLSTLPRGESFTHLIHAAADSTLGPQLTPLERYIQIVDGTRNMLDYAVANSIPRFLLTSSGGVYGPQPQNLTRIPEDYNGMPDPLIPQNAYSVAKRCAEHLCALYQDRYGIETVMARCFAFIGRDLPLGVHFAIGNFIRDALQNSSINVAGDGTPVRTYMDQRDLATWLIALLKRGRPGHAYNVGSDEEITIRDLAYLVRDALSQGKPVKILGKADGQALRNRYVPSIDKARSELGLTLRFSLKDSILESVDSL